MEFIEKFENSAILKTPKAELEKTANSLVKAFKPDPAENSAPAANALKLVLFWRFVAALDIQPIFDSNIEYQFAKTLDDAIKPFLQSRMTKTNNPLIREFGYILE